MKDYAHQFPLKDDAAKLEDPHEDTYKERQKWHLENFYSDFADMIFDQGVRTKHRDEFISQLSHEGRFSWIYDTDYLKAVVLLKQNGINPQQLKYEDEADMQGLINSRYNCLLYEGDRQENLNDFSDMQQVKNWKNHIKKFNAQQRAIYNLMIPIYDQCKKLEYDADGWQLMSVFQGDQVKIEYKKSKKTGNLIVRA